MLSVNPSLAPDDVEAIPLSSVHPFPAHATCGGICTKGTWMQVLLSGSRPQMR
jgi:hypothetical protein